MHLLLFFFDIHYKIKTEYADADQKHVSRITVLKVKNSHKKSDMQNKKRSVERKQVKNLHVKQFEFDKLSMAYEKVAKHVYEKDYNTVKLPDEKHFIKVPPKKEVIHSQTIKPTYNQHIPFLTPRYSTEKIYIPQTAKKIFSKQSAAVSNNLKEDNFYKVKLKESEKKVYKKSANFDKYVAMYRDEVFLIVYRKFQKYIRNKRFKNETAILTVNINQAGEVLDLSFKELSSNEEFNKLCKRVIEDIGNFPPFPKVLQVDIIKLTIPFKVRLP